MYNKLLVFINRVGIEVMEMIGTRLKRARAVTGLSMDALGKQVGVSANMIKKYEHNISMPSSAVLLKLARALNVRSEYFFRPIQAELTEIKYRKLPNVPAFIRKKVEVDVQDQAERWLELDNLCPDDLIKSFSKIQSLPKKISTLEQAEEAAKKVRINWKLGTNPLPDLMGLLESKGILVIVTEMDVQNKFDGLKVEVKDLPIVVVWGGWPGDRQRFILAHELGHLLLGESVLPKADEEKICDRFAAALLLPEVMLHQYLGKQRHNLELRELHFLKHEFGLSMRACLHRAQELGVIEEKTHKRLGAQFPKKERLEKEPGIPYMKEKTSRFQKMVYRALGEGIVGESKAAELLNMPLIKFHQERNLKINENSDPRESASL